MKEFIAACTLVLGIVHLSYAQGVVIEDGFGIGAGVTAAENVTNLTGSAGYAAGGIVDFGITVGRSWLDNTEMTSNSIAPSIGLYPVRQGEDIPVSIRLGGSYSFETLDSPDLNSDVDVTGKTFSGTGSVFHRMETSDQFAVIPQIGAYFMRTTTEIASGLGSISNSENNIGFQLGVALVFITSKSSQFVLTPAMGVSDGNFSGGASLSMIFPTN